MTVTAEKLDEVRLAQLSDQVGASGRGAAWRVLGAGVMALFLLLLAGCANTVFHFFSFDTSESPGIEILDYQYGESQQSRARPSEAEKRNGTVRQIASMGGDILRPDKLYVRWRVLDTGAEYEETVDLAKLLPRDIRRHEIHFTVEGSRLYVYLVSPRRREPGEPSTGPQKFRNQKVTTLWSGYGRSVSKS